MKINLGIMPLASGEVEALQEFSDGTIRLTFKLASGKTATLVMSMDEAKHIYGELKEIIELARGV